MIAYYKPLEFLENALLTDTEDCIIWPYGTRRGYGDIRIGEHKKFAHREICCRAHGPPPTPSHEAAHSCNVRSCVNYKHIRWATRIENESDKKIHGTRYKVWEHNNGVRSSSARLTEDQVHWIRHQLELGIHIWEIAKHLGMGTTSIRNIRDNRKWCSLPKQDPYIQLWSDLPIKEVAAA
jgi:hypothetical protein